MAEPLLQVRDLRKAFGGIRAVDGVGFDLGAGEVCALIGPNGAGKTTLFHLLAGQLRPDAGSVRLRGEELTGLPAFGIWRRGIGRTFQITATFASLTCLENVQAALASKAGRRFDLWTPAAALARQPGLELLAQVGLAAQAGRRAHALAFGDRKRLELALALAGDPALLLLDEPAAGMAPAERGELMALVSALVEARGLAVLFTEHDMDVVFGTAARVMVLHEGRLIADGSPAAVRADAGVQAAYLGSPDAEGAAQP
ncbi:MAG: ABC transporter ATP-binding protein [Candidatus Methylomirabilales bacterium]